MIIFTVNCLSTKMMVKVIIVFLTMKIKAIRAVNLGDISDLKEGSRIDLSLTLGSPSKRLKLIHSPISSVGTSDTNFRRLDYDQARDALDLELESDRRIISQSAQPEKLSATSPIRNGNERQSLDLLGPHSNAHPCRFRSEFPTPYEGLNLFDSQIFNDDSVRESVFGEEKGSGSSDQSDFLLTSRVRNPEVKNRIVIESKTTYPNKAANFISTRKNSSADQRTFYNNLPQNPTLIKSIYSSVEHRPSISYRAEPSQKTAGIKCFANDEKLAEELSHARQNAQGTIIDSETFQEQNFGNQKKKTEVKKEFSDENFIQRMVKRKDMLEEDTNLFSSNIVQGIDIRSLEAYPTAIKSDDQIIYRATNFETYDYPYHNVIKIDEQGVYLMKALLTKLIKQEKNITMDRNNALKNAVVSLHEKFEEYEEYFNTLKAKWITEWSNMHQMSKLSKKLISTINKIAYNIQFATVYTNERIGFINEKNSLKFFVDNETAKIEVLKILKNIWDSIPVAQNLTSKGKLKRPENIKTNNKAIDSLEPNKFFLRNIFTATLKRNEILSSSSNLLKYILKILLPQIYHSIFEFDNKEIKASSYGLIRRLNDISLQQYKIS
ncbi:expressed protein [Phakopsora pachyrhizi]|uniref:Expressed protein n=1 Tax=Phakopsora pachyrhizi TaxID=170000 RepID=A0AAV0AZG2_PHAPC|nr:expressed protein [Phakopsora pachyrhizi]